MLAEKNKMKLEHDVNEAIIEKYIFMMRSIDS